MLTPDGAGKLVERFERGKRELTLGNMRPTGVRRSLLVYCVACHRDVVFDAEAYDDDLPALPFSPRAETRTSRPYR